ncbi:alpha-galactosidase [Halolactibacillus miurensis]|uniref:Alpha-galactosidase n=1 Tax=Halolactibacillus miurensis TaxID=306541 RepID=A0A1I6SBX7_9BACI|nr:alpha-galactosidase [Halolactibacillus miurensis]GEM03997.1 alpha-galactosidase [Halolactibacillus miurensis]SFS74437.1 alpha-galactosidase [Halolactibacillus miurensis]
MAIYVNEETLTFHLTNRDVSYLFSVLPNGELTHLYYGKKLSHVADFSQLFYTEVKDNSCTEADAALSMDVIRQEYPSFSRSDFRLPAVQLTNKDGHRVSRFTYTGYEKVKGKTKLKGLPATYVESSEEADTLKVFLRDEVLEATLTLSYTIYQHHPVITRHVTLTNHHRDDLIINQMMSASLDFNHNQFDWLELAGSWARERHIKRTPLHAGIQNIQSTRGASSPQHNPFIALLRPETAEHVGEAYGFSLVYSGNFLAQMEVDHYDTTRVTMGINPFDFNWRLERDETFTTPEVVMVYSDQGLNKLSQVYHTLYRTRLARGVWRDKLRPVLINNWEATYFNFNEDKLLQMATEAKQLGVELFVLDDGWFKGRNSDTTSLGDWFVDEKKLPNGLRSLSEKIHGLGLQFGLWIEPEMISPKSELYHAHPDWVVGVNNRPNSPGRNQYVLDFSNKAVIDYIYHLIKERLTEANVDYVKWDMNRFMTEAGSVHLAPADQTSFRHRYILGVYRLYELLTTDFPNVLFESCAAGGARFDPGMLYYAPQGWTSDDTDALERVKIQYGTSLVYPASMMGAHVSAVPNHQTGRMTPIETRGVVAFSGMLGYELDPSQLSKEEKTIVQEQIRHYKQVQPVVQFGQMTRLISPFDDPLHASWQFVSQDETDVLVTYIQQQAQPNPAFRQLKLVGLKKNKAYTLVGTDSIFYGDQLMYHGLELDRYIDRSDAGDARGYLLHFKVQEETE